MIKLILLLLVSTPFLSAASFEFDNKENKEREAMIKQLEKQRKTVTKRKKALEKERDRIINICKDATTQKLIRQCDQKKLENHREQKRLFEEIKKLDKAIWALKGIN